jgi:hypothetical protein
LADKPGIKKLIGENTMKNILFLILIIGYNNLAQELNEEIIIQGPQPNEWFKSSPVIDIDSQGNIGIVWANNYNDHYTINFVRSTDGGITFDSIRVVEDIPYHPDWGGWYTPVIKFDVFDNPLVIYYSYLNPWSYQFRIKKSLDGGNSFPTNYQYFNEFDDNSGFMLSDSGVGYLALAQYPAIKILKTCDHGISFPDSSFISTGNFAVLTKIQLVQCGNGDILCFWDGQDQTTHRNAVFYTRSTDGGYSFSPYIELDSTTMSPTGINAVSNNNEIFIIYRGKSDSTNHQLLYRTSDDYGYTFSDLNLFYNFGTSAVTSSLTTLRFLPEVGLCIAWNYMNAVKKIMFTRTEDFGATFDSSLTIVSERRRRNQESMAVSDLGDIFIVSTEQVDYYYYYIILNKIRIPLLTAIDPDENSIHTKFKLHQNYPNPFNSNTKISYQLEIPAFISVVIYNLLGQEIEILINEKQQNGEHEVHWQAEQYPSGIYFYKLNILSSKGKTYSITKELILIK